MKLPNKTHYRVIWAAMFLAACSTARPRPADPLDQVLRSHFEKKTMAMWCLLPEPSDCQNVVSRLQRNEIQVLEGRQWGPPEKWAERKARKALIKAHANYVLLVSTTSFEQKGGQEEFVMTSSTTPIYLTVKPVKPVEDHSGWGFLFDVLNTFGPAVFR